MVRRTKEEALETRNSILDAAERVFFEKGVSRTSLADIAQAAGVTRGAIYWHFSHKSDLFTEMFDRVLLPLDELKAASLDPNEPDPLGRLMEICIVCVRDTATDQRRRRVFDILFLKCELVEEMGPVMVRYQTNMREALIKIEGGLRNAISKGQLPEDLDTKLAAAMVHAFVGGSLRDMLFLPDATDFTALGERMVEGIFDALRLSPALRKST
ncbi:MULTISPECIES: TetR family transcriptional regulator [Paraburkholderia]|jgi:TetR/AcrR family acrAB operon transcriptional repressor|uniref:TetR/AcrR family acrAB operon transcriptional repressor n=2 Tax=Paraburkholderia TaxID=1822464 RepID=A0AB73IF69_9BURK|nr:MULTISPECIES: TetR family transcriptional regulator [Paraburkholderia]OWJ58404.1 TetR family transcriptional regulator [Burkholderia sp. Bk]MDP9648574.1 TetR/AcrR family acrAB operon transcriptional repressor [Paraburkholderia caledonica]MDR6377143.1 TetR/AcrR family acrAB operon transcriptional repressor [Paraburkholderia caledonica]MDR7004830.1 TetR/AcrR family acrAB operon transcriptional repressor [Paraburkholderia strydomiana]CAH2896114.1 MAG: Transcriptional regulator, AcrR family [un